MNSRHFLIVVILVVGASITAGFGVFARSRWWGPHTTSKTLLTPSVATSIAIGQPLPNVTLNDLEGRRLNLQEARGKVVVFLVQGNKCPCSKAYVDRVNALHDEYGPKGVEIWAFNPNVSETAEETREFVRANNVKYSTSYDENLMVADMLQAACTTEAWVADREGILRYHGRIDDNIYKPAEVKKQDLREALDAVLAGTPVPNPETSAYACTISRSENL